MTTSIYSYDEEQAPATSPEKETKEIYRPELDGIRAFCILFTIANHTPGTPTIIDGSVGVDIFFGLSGWLITTLLCKEHDNLGKINLTAFYVRRFFRIIPLYAATVLAYMIISYIDGKLHLTGSKSANSVAEFWQSLPYLISMCVEYRPAAVGDVMAHAWTIGIEEKFYILWPLIMFACARSRLSMAVSALATVALIFIAFGISSYIIRGYCGLFFGSICALLIIRSSKANSWLSAKSIALPALLFMAGCYAGLVLFPHPAVNIVIGMGGTVMIASLWFNRDQFLTKLLRFGYLPWLGRLTYAIYLLQSLCIRIAELMLKLLGVKAGFPTIFIVSYAVCIPVAYAAHKLVERPMILLGKRISAEIHRNSVKLRQPSFS